MAQPKHRTTSSKRNQRRSHHALKKVNLAVCPKCKSKTLSHTACANCGTYKGKEVIDVVSKLEKKEQKKNKDKEKTN